MKHKYILKIVYAALFAALIFVGTQLIQIPLPFGYVNFGDGFVLLSAVMVGGPYAVVAAAVGAALADILSGYVPYVPATLVIKALMVVVMLGMGKLGKKKGRKGETVMWTVGAVLAELVMAGGYFLYDTALYGLAGALTALPGNLLQGGIAVVASTLLITVLAHSRLWKHIRLTP